MSASVSFSSHNCTSHTGNLTFQGECTFLSANILNYYSVFQNLIRLGLSQYLSKCMHTIYSISTEEKRASGQDIDLAETLPSLRERRSRPREGILQ